MTAAAGGQPGWKSIVTKNGFQVTECILSLTMQSK